MNTYILYSIIVTIIAIIVILTLVVTRSPRMFDKINGYTNVLRDLHIKNGLDITTNGYSLDDKIKADVSSYHGAGSATFSTSKDSILSTTETVFNILDYGGNANPQSGYVIENIDSSLMNNTSDYVCAIYVKRLSDDVNDEGTVFWGPMNGVGDYMKLNDAGEISTNPYFISNNVSDLDPGEWYLMIGVFRGINSMSETVSTGTGVYMLKDSTKVKDGTDIKNVDVDKLGFRMFITNDRGTKDDKASQLSLSRQFVFKVDGDVTDDIMNGIVEKMLTKK
jgi:hypothetical protein